MIYSVTFLSEHTVYVEADSVAEAVENAVEEMDWEAPHFEPVALILQDDAVAEEVEEDDEALDMSEYY